MADDGERAAKAARAKEKVSFAVLLWTFINQQNLSSSDSKLQRASYMS